MLTGEAGPQLQAGLVGKFTLRVKTCGFTCNRELCGSVGATVQFSLGNCSVWVTEPAH